MNPEKLSITTILNISNNTCFLSCKSAYYNDLWRIMWHCSLKFSFAITGVNCMKLEIILIIFYSIIVFTVFFKLLIHQFMYCIMWLTDHYLEHDALKNRMALSRFQTKWQFRTINIIKQLLNLITDMWVFLSDIDYPQQWFYMQIGSGIDCVSVLEACPHTVHRMACYHHGLWYSWRCSFHFYEDWCSSWHGG